MKYNTVVIGGGLAGLTAGATLAKFGKKVLLIEQHHKPGGCATTFKRGDFIIEVGLHEMSGLTENGTIKDIFKMLEVDQHVQIQQVPEFYAVLSDKGDFVFPHGYKAATKALIDRYPEDEKGIKRFFKLVAGIRSESTRLPRTPLKRKLFYPLMPLLYPNLVEATRHTVGSWLDKYITNENAKLDMTAHLAYWGDDPYGLSMFYFGMPFSAVRRTPGASGAGGGSGRRGNGKRVRRGPASLRYSSEGPPEPSHRRAQVPSTATLRARASSSMAVTPAAANPNRP